MFESLAARIGLVGAVLGLVACAAPTGEDDEDAEVAASGLATNALYVSPSGSDSNDGSASSPFKTVTKGLKSVRAGGTLYVRGGTYVENVTVTPSPGTSTSHVHVENYPNEKPLVKGLLRLSSASYYDIKGINVTWNDANSSSDHMVKMSGGTGWSITNAEIYGAKSFAGLLVSGNAKNFTVAFNRIHHTYKSNATNQDHLIYINQADGGVVERNELWESPNGRAIKVGNVTSGTSLPRGIIIRYNTMYRNFGPSNVQLSYAANGCQVYRNIMVESSDANLTQYNLTGTNNVAHDNIGWKGAGVVEAGGGLKDTGGNKMLDPQFVNASGADFHPQNVAATAYGRWAP